MNVTAAAAPMKVQIRVEPGGAVFAAARGALLLDVLREAGLPISYSCQSGRCGTCRCALITGEVDEAPAEYRALAMPCSARHVLACRARLLGDCVIALLEPDEPVTHPAQILRSRVESVVRLNEATLALSLRTNRRLAFSAGQFAQLDFGAGLVRPYSMANAPGEDLLEFHLRLVRNGRVTGHVADHVRSGDQVKLIGPLGTSYLRRRHAGPILCVAGGTGLAPLRSIVRTVLLDGLPSPIHMYVGARTEADLYGIDELRSLERSHPAQLRVHVGVDEPASSGGIRHGRITELVAADLRSLSGWKVYLAGPPAMVEAATSVALAAGARPADIHADAFYPVAT